MDEYAAVMERWAKNPDEMDYWVPASSTSDAIDAVAKWEFKSETDDSGVDSTPVTVERFCLLQLTVANPMGEPHKCEASVVLRLAQPFLDAGKQVCYMALVCGGEEAKWDTHRSAEQKMYVRDIYQMPPITKSVDIQQIKLHYYASHTHLNPFGIVPAGPGVDFTRPHDRNRFKNAALPSY
ncbi:hypothetical protein PR001_g14372 [Phytophthora rubi]|uniref:Uncharacterized protein n=1 Tax=Phytophthora rubi TaxID=129364 RepID=A0A6A3LNZ5_9STRA|nr:hypothetical protein PR001_g14372 [Phytophthora rubi]